MSPAADRAASAGRNSPEARAARLEALEAFEGNLWDVINMAGITMELADEALDSPGEHQPGASGKVHDYQLSARELDHLLFASTHTVQMATALKDRYLAALGLG